MEFFQPTMANGESNPTRWITENGYSIMQFMYRKFSNFTHKECKPYFCGYLHGKAIFEGETFDQARDALERHSVRS